MTVAAINSREARAKWRDLLDTASKGEDLIIERNGKPVVALIAYGDFEALQEELDDLRAGRRASVAHEAWKRDPSRGRPYSEIRAELVAEGLLRE